MKRDWDLNEISDGKKYGLSDLVKADANDCKGCSACCHDMGSSIVLDPFDFYRLQSNLKLKFEEMLQGYVELNMVDGLILPNLKMDTGKENNPCVFLNEEGRCSIHGFRPGICRIFPLARVYEENDFYYILQVHECAKEEKSKIKVSKWIDTPDLKLNQQFILDWHNFIKEIGSKNLACNDEGLIRKVTMLVLQSFYIEPFSNEEENGNFYEQFSRRLAQTKNILDSLF